MITNNIICGITSPLIVDIISNCNDKDLKYASSNNLNSTFRSDKLKKKQCVIWCKVQKEPGSFAQLQMASNYYTTEIDLVVNFM